MGNNKYSGSKLPSLLCCLCIYFVQPTKISSQNVLGLSASKKGITSNATPKIIITKREQVSLLCYILVEKLFVGLHNVLH